MNTSQLSQLITDELLLANDTSFEKRTEYPKVGEEFTPYKKYGNKEAFKVVEVDPVFSVLKSDSGQTVILSNNYLIQSKNM